MDNLLEQNKTIARGLSLMHEANSSVPTTSQPQQPPQPPQVTQPPIPQTQQAIQPIQPTTSQAQTMPKPPPINAERYQKSISSANEQEQGY